MVAVYIGVTVFINYSRKETHELIKNLAPSSKPAAVDKKSADQENVEKLKQLKILESKLDASQKKHAEALHLRDIIEAQLQTRMSLLQSTETQINHLLVLHKEGALNDQDLELARSQLKGIEVTIEKTRSDSLKVTNFLDTHAKKMAQEESDLNEFKNQMNLNSKN